MSVWFLNLRLSIQQLKYCPIMKPIQSICRTNLVPRSNLDYYWCILVQPVKRYIWYNYNRSCPKISCWSLHSVYFRHYRNYVNVTWLEKSSARERHKSRGDTSRPQELAKRAQQDFNREYFQYRSDRWDVRWIHTGCNRKDRWSVAYAIYALIS